MPDADIAVNSFGVFQGYYEDHYLSHYSSSAIAWIGGVQQFLLFFGVSSELLIGVVRSLHHPQGLPVGRWFDAHGAAILLWPGTLLLTLSIMFTSCGASLVVSQVLYISQC